MKPPALMLAAICCATLVGGVACNGGIGGHGSPGGGGITGTGTAGNGTGGSGQPPDPNAAGVLQLRRLTSREYLATVRDLLGDTSLGVGDVPGESDDLSNNAFPFRQPTAIGTLDAANLQVAAETLATNMSTKLSTILPCTPASASDEASCAGMFISTFGPKAFRRPLSATETGTLTTLYQTGRTTL